MFTSLSIRPRERPLYFLHIAKTGGSSLTDAIARRFPEELVLRNGGEITGEYLQSVEDRLDRGVFIAGHPHTGILRILASKADVVTFLRNPETQTISHYLHVRRDPTNARHREATRLSFFDFVMNDPMFLAHQTRTLAVAVASDFVGDLGALRQLLPEVMSALQHMALVGITERSDEAAELLARLVATNQAIRPQRLNSSAFHGVDEDEIAELRRVYGKLRDHPSTSEFVALEEQTYRFAVEALDARAEGGAGHAQRRSGAAVKCFEPRMFFGRQGPIRGDSHTTALAGHAGHLIYGPYASLPKGRHTVRFMLRLEGVAFWAGGRLEMEVAANQGRTLARRTARPQWRSNRWPYKVAFTARDPADILEFRISASGYAGGRLVFEGATVASGWRGCVDLWRRSAGRITELRSDARES